jgi:hypothetical protein
MPGGATTGMVGGYFPRTGGRRSGRDAATRGEASMSKPPRRANYRRKLAHVVVLADSTKLVTLRDAANVLLEVFGSVNARSGALDHTIRLLLLARRAPTIETRSPGLLPGLPKFAQSIEPRCPDEARAWLGAPREGHSST